MLLSLFVAFVSVITAVAFIAPTKAMAQTDDYYTTDYDWDSDYYDSYYDDYTYDYSTEDAAAALLGLASSATYIIIIGSICVSLVLYVFSGLVYSTIGKKLKEENTWMAWVPLLNLYYITKISGLNPWLSLIYLLNPIVPIGFIVMAILTTYKIGLRRGFESWVGLVGGLGVLIPIVHPVFLGYIAWGEPSPKTTTTA